MLHKLLQLATGTVLVPPPKVYLNKVVRCRKCGQEGRLTRLVRLSPSGMRGYYQCHKGHLWPIDRDGVTRQTGQSHDRIFLA